MYQTKNGKKVCNKVCKRNARILKKTVFMNIPCHFHIFEAMDCFYFMVMRGSAKCSFPLANESLLVVSSEYWLMLVEQSELMNFGRLLSFYGYMSDSHASWRV